MVNTRAADVVELLHRAAQKEALKMLKIREGLRRLIVRQREDLDVGKIFASHHPCQEHLGPISQS
jgi:hypothetical protein